MWLITFWNYILHYGECYACIIVLCTFKAKNSFTIKMFLRFKTCNYLTLNSHSPKSVHIIKVQSRSNKLIKSINIQVTSNINWTGTKAMTIRQNSKTTFSTCLIVIALVIVTFGFTVFVVVVTRLQLARVSVYTIVWIQHVEVQV